jgi:hypothetical protein
MFLAEHSEICSLRNILYRRKCMYKAGIVMKRSGGAEMGNLKTSQTPLTDLEFGTRRRRAFQIIRLPWITAAMITESVLMA